MEIKQTIRARVQAGLTSFGLSVVLPIPSVIELAVKAGYDFVRIDCEHSYMSPVELRGLLSTARLLGIPCQVRTPDAANLTPLLGQEPAAIMIPHVDSAAYARQIVDSCKFAPLGTRGMDAGTRSIRCGGMSRSEYMSYAARAQDVIVQIESRSAIQYIDEILSVEGVDMVATGRADLSQELGVAGQKDHPDVIEAENFIIQKMMEYGKIPTIAADTAQRVQQLYEMGVRCFLVGKDENLLDKALKKNLREKACVNYGPVS